MRSYVSGRENLKPCVTVLEPRVLVTYIPQQQPLCHPRGPWLRYEQMVTPLVLHAANYSPVNIPLLHEDFWYNDEDQTQLC
uniref:(California timema) hypothetical protein n=1 Tax=Timema californicum TaxID=61474 RepID=A0A7R9IW84_TIMCA|nr:unnamed protein product [Timema californicum]